MGNSILYQIYAGYEKNVKKKDFFVRRKAKVSLVGIVLRAESLFSRISAGKF